MEEKKYAKYNIKLIVLIVLIIVTLSSATYAFLAAIKVVDTGETVASCFNVNYEGNVLSNALISTTDYLEGNHSQITLSKNENCDIYTTADIYVHTDINETTAPINTYEALKYKILLAGEEIAAGVITATEENSEKLLKTVNLTETPTTYDIYIWVDRSISLGIYNGTTYSGYLYATSDQTSTIGPLSQVNIGSYVAYTGNNGCTGDSCSGDNANSSATSNGYCYSSSYEYNSSGWRVAYIENGSAYLISAGATDCMCTNSNGTSSNSSCSTNITTSNDMNKHLNNMNTIALKYCNSTYAKSGTCDATTARAMNEIDFNKMNESNLSTCYLANGSDCGFNNDLIDNGGYYWYSTIGYPTENKSGLNTYFWEATNSSVGLYNSNYIFGVRPIIALDPSVTVISGSGTESDPYQISK